VYLNYAGVDTEIFCPKKREPGDCLELLFIGQIMPEKGIDILIKAVQLAAKQRKLKLTIIGDGNMKSTWNMCLPMTRRLYGPVSCGPA